MPRLARLLAIGLAVAACAAPGNAPSGAAGSPAAVATAAVATSAPSSLPAEVTVSVANQLRDAGSLVLDVRQPSEWADGHIAGATLIPLGDLQARLGELPRDRSIVVVCHSGNRSAQGRDVLLAAGFPTVTSMSGGMSAWIAAGLPVVTGS